MAWRRAEAGANRDFAECSPFIKGSWTVPRGLKREVRPADVIGASAARA